MMPSGRDMTLRCWGSKARITGYLDRTHKICTAYSPSFFEAQRPLAPSSALSGAAAKEARHGRHTSTAAPARAQLFATLAANGGLKKSEGEGPLSLYGAGPPAAPAASSSASADQQPKPARKSVSVTTIRGKHRRGERLSMLTAYDYPSARLADQAGVDILLVGDSLGMVVLGYDSTTPGTHPACLFPSTTFCQLSVSPHMPTVTHAQSPWTRCSTTPRPSRVDRTTASRSGISPSVPT